jgi:hypothetical protein
MTTPVSISDHDLEFEPVDLCRYRLEPEDLDLIEPNNDDINVEGHFVNSCQLSYGRADQPVGSRRLASLCSPKKSSTALAN